jgi:hypothetical protein
MAQAPQTFIHKKKLDMLATAIRDNMPYVRASEQKYPQSELKGKKYGAEVNVYLTDAGRVSDGIVANPDNVHEIQLTAYMQNKNTAVETDIWEDYNDIESFAKEVLKPRALKLARTIEKDVIDHNILRGMQAVAAPKTSVALDGASFDFLSQAATKLDELSVTGRKVQFASPSVYAKIASTGLAKFLPDAIQTDIYRNKYLGEYAGASCVEQALLPTVKLSANADTAPTLTFTPVKEGSTIVGYTVGALTASGAGKTIEEGAAYVVPGVYLLDESGMETDQPLVVIVHKVISGTSKGTLTEALGIEDLRVTAKGYSEGTPNVWVDPTTFDSTSTTTTVTCSFIPGMGAGKNYIVGQCRIDDALVFDSYSFSDLPSSRQENVGNEGPITLKAMAFGDGKNGVQMTRIDAPYLATMWEPRRSVVTFVEV